MKKSLPVFAVVFLLAALSIAQIVKPPYILGKDDERIKSKNFLAGRKPSHGSTYQIYDNRKPGGASIFFDKTTNEFDMVTGAENNNRAIRGAQQELRNAERMLLIVTGVARADRCKLKVIMRIVVPGTTDGGLSYGHLPSCGEFN